MVTGGAGFLGSHLCDELLSRGHRVICVDNLETGSLANIEHIRDPDAFVGIVDRHNIAVYAFLARRAGRQTAEDLLGEVWVSALASRSRYDQAFADARPWLFGIARNTLYRRWRDRAAVDPHPQWFNRPAAGEDPWPAVDVRVDTRTVLRAAVAGLRSEEREVLTLVAGEDLTVADAARVLGLPAGTARRLLHQARAALRNAPEVAALLTELNSVKGSK